MGDSGYARISRAIIKHSKKLAQEGIVFPVLGICRGSQMIMSDETEEELLVVTDSLNLSLPLDFTTESQQSRLFGKAPEGLKKALSRLPLGFHAHKYSIPTSIFKDVELKKKFRVITTNYDRKGVEFVSTFEGMYSYRCEQSVMGVYRRACRNSVS